MKLVCEMNYCQPTRIYIQILSYYPPSFFSSTGFRTLALYLCKSGYTEPQFQLRTELELIFSSKFEEMPATLNAYSDGVLFLISFNIEKVNVPQDKIILNDSSHKLNITLKTHGFKWLKYYFAKPKLSIDFSNEVYKKQNAYIYTKSVSYLNEKKPFQENVKLLNINPDTLIFKYDTNLVKKIPVQIDTDITFAPGFDNVNNYKTIPDSIVIVLRGYGYCKT